MRELNFNEELNEKDREIEKLEKIINDMYLTATICKTAFNNCYKL